MADFQIQARDDSGTAVDLAQLVALARFAMNRLRLHPRTELSLRAVDLAEMERLHVQYMDEPGATDVLSFPMDLLTAPAEGESAAPGTLGDIVLCPEFAAEQAAANGQSLAAELELLTVHGLLHLLGHDHAEPAEHAVMFGLQAEMLDAWRMEQGRA